MLRFVRRNVDILGFPDLLIGMVRVGNRVVVFSHHDKVGSQLLQLVRSRIEEEVRREEAEIEREEGGDENTGSVKATPMHVRIRGPMKPGTPYATPGTHRYYKVIVSNKSAAPTPKPAVVSTVGKPVISNGGGDAKPTVTASVPENKKKKKVATGSRH